MEEKKSRKSWNEFVSDESNWEVVGESMCYGIQIKRLNLKGIDVYVEYRPYPPAGTLKGIHWNRYGEYFIDSEIDKDVFVPQHMTKTTLIEFLWKTERGY